MRWDSLEPDLLKRMNFAPGSTSIADAVVDALDLRNNENILDLCPGAGVFAAMLAREHKVKITSVVADPLSEALAESTANVLGVSGRVRVIPGSAKALPVASEEFNRIFCIGHPFAVSPAPEVATELYRVLMPGGIICLAGPAAFSNETPEYMLPALDEFEGARIRTPAYTALMFSREGFHIAIAEYLPEAWDRWTEWLENAPADMVPALLRRAIIEDGGRWLSLGLIVLRKPPRPSWAV